MKVFSEDGYVEKNIGYSYVESSREGAWREAWRLWRAAGHARRGTVGQRGQSVEVEPSQIG